MKANHLLQSNIRAASGDNAEIGLCCAHRDAIVQLSTPHPLANFVHRAKERRISRVFN